MFCSICGSQLSEGASFCTKCGAEVNKSSQRCYHQPSNNNGIEVQTCNQQWNQMQSPAAPAQLQPVQQVSPAIVQQMPPNYYCPEQVSPKRKKTAALFAIFLGAFGVHRFYVGRTGSAVAMLLMGIFSVITWFIVIGIFLCMAVAIWAFVDFIVILSGGFRDSLGRPIKN